MTLVEQRLTPLPALSDPAPHADEPDPADYLQALRHAPLICFDRHEPFLPLAVGYTVFRTDGPSRSFSRDVVLPPGAALGIEYAIWWDWDIQHLYELEHIWVYLDQTGRVIKAEASWHGLYNEMIDEAGQPPLEAGRLVLHSESGKHAFAPSARWLHERADMTHRHCTTLAGVMGLHVTPVFESALRRKRNPLVNGLVLSALRRHAFQPSFIYDLVFDLRETMVVPWSSLAEWIPQRVTWWVRRLGWLVLLPEHSAPLQAPDPARGRVPLRPAGQMGEAPVLFVRPRQRLAARLLKEAGWTVAGRAIRLYLDGKRLAWQTRRLVFSQTPPE
ncbi:MAG: hypothetical protein JW910_07410 [Anaerolineae bacterium]|nr:hypothetical protein [Anaerolineae bacterium]